MSAMVSNKDGYPPKSAKTSSLGKSGDVVASADQDTQESFS
jgi:hypothetical protein